MKHTLMGYTDADGSMAEDHHAISGYAFLVDGGAVSWLPAQSISTCVITLFAGSLSKVWSDLSIVSLRTWWPMFWRRHCHLWRWSTLLLASACAQSERVCWNTCVCKVRWPVCTIIPWIGFILVSIGFGNNLLIYYCYCSDAIVLYIWFLDSYFKDS